jgi:hypothetical protein
VIDFPKQEGTSITSMHTYNWVVPSDFFELKNVSLQELLIGKKIILGVNRRYRVWPGIEPGTSRKLSFRVYPKRESYR